MKGREEVGRGPGTPSARQQNPARTGCRGPFGENKGVFKHVEDMRVLAGIESGIQKLMKHLHGRQMLPAYEDLYAVLKKSLK